MRIGIDISQLAYEGTGVENYLGNFLLALRKLDTENTYVLFFSSLRGSLPTRYLKLVGDNFTIKYFKFPQSLLSILWNTLHILPIEKLIGDIDVFISSDWTEPPALRAKKITILYDLIIYKYPHETDKKIIATQKRKLAWSTKECVQFLCISKATKNDAMEILKLPADRLSIIYPGGAL